MGKRFRVGIIGTGKHGSRYAEHIVRDLKTSFELVAISRRSDIGRKQAEEWNCLHFTDWRELVAYPDVEIVISATTPNLNLEIAQDCVQSAKPLLLEKPIATDFYQAKEIVERFAASSLPLTIGQTLRYNSVIRALRNRIAGLGQLYFFSASQRLEPSTLAWLENPKVAGGGVIFHTGVHLFDALRYITGEEIEAIRATSRRVHNRGLEDLVAGEIRLRSGVIGVFDTSKVSPSRISRYEFVCEHGQLLGDQVHGSLDQVVAMECTKLMVEPPGPTILTLLTDWASFLVGEGVNPVPPEAGLAAVKVCHGCRESVVQGGWFSLDDL